MKTLKFLFGYAKNYTSALVVTVISMLSLVGVQLLAPWIIKQMIAAVKDQSQMTASLDTVTQLAIMAFVIYLARSGLQFLRSYMSHVAGWGVVADARRQIYRHLQRLSLRFYEDRQIGDLMSRMVNDSDMFETLIAHAIPDTLVNILMLIGVSTVLVSLNAQLMLLSLIPVPNSSSWQRAGLPNMCARHFANGRKNWANSTRRSTTTSPASARSKHLRGKTSRPSASANISHYRDSLLRCG